MRVDQPLESLESQSCADYDDKTEMETAGLMGDSEVRYSVLQVCIMLILHAQCQKHGSCEEIMGPLPSERGIIADGMSTVRDIMLLSTGLLKSSQSKMLYLRTYCPRIAG